MNIDEIVISPKTSNFFELFEQNLNNQKYKLSSNNNKPIKK
jgi:hypothetical protein